MAFPTLKLPGDSPRAHIGCIVPLTSHLRNGSSSRIRPPPNPWSDNTGLNAASVTGRNLTSYICADRSFTSGCVASGNGECVPPSGAKRSGSDDDEERLRYDSAGDFSCSSVDYDVADGVCDFTCAWRAGVAFNRDAATRASAARYFSDRIFVDIEVLSVS